MFNGKIIALFCVGRGIFYGIENDLTPFTLSANNKYEHMYEGW